MINKALPAQGSTPASIPRPQPRRDMGPVASVPADTRRRFSASRHTTSTIPSPSVLPAYGYREVVPCGFRPSVAAYNIEWLHDKELGKMRLQNRSLEEQSFLKHCSVLSTRPGPSVTVRMVPGLSTLQPRGIVDRDGLPGSFPMFSQTHTNPFPTQVPQQD